MGTQTWDSSPSCLRTGKMFSTAPMANEVKFNSQCALAALSGGRTGTVIPDVLLDDFHATGIYEYAEELGVLTTEDESPTMPALQNGKHAELLAGKAACSSPAYNQPSMLIYGQGHMQQYGSFQPCAGPSGSIDSGSMGSIGAGSEGVAVTPGRNSIAQLRQFEEAADDLDSPDDHGKKRTKRTVRGTTGDKAGKGLRHFSMKVCEKVESKGRTTYNEVADELVLEFSSADNMTTTAEGVQQFDEKNIRRRVYDALNVLMAMDIIAKEKKEIHWKGLPSTNTTNVEHLKREYHHAKEMVARKREAVRDLEDQLNGTHELIKRNQNVYCGEDSAPPGGVVLPFILVQTKPQATIEVEISEDMHLVHFDFNSTPFQLYDDVYVLRAMGLCKGRHAGDSRFCDAKFLSVEPQSEVQGSGMPQFMTQTHTAYQSNCEDTLPSPDMRQRGGVPPPTHSPGQCVGGHSGGVTYSLGPTGMVPTGGTFVSSGFAKIRAKQEP